VLNTVFQSFFKYLLCPAGGAKLASQTSQDALDLPTHVNVDARADAGAEPHEAKDVPRAQFDPTLRGSSQRLQTGLVEAPAEISNHVDTCTVDVDL
jgi:hypothetical protein